MLTSVDIKAMEKLMPKIVEAAGIMEKARAWLGADLENVPAVTQKLVGDLDVKLVMFVHDFQKRVKTRTQFKLMGDIVHDFARGVQEQGGNLAKCPWELPEAKPAASGTPAASAAATQKH